MKALVVDDSSMLRMLVTNLLSKAGYKVTQAEDGQIGLDVVSNMGSPDLVVLDWNMPVLDGYGFLCKFREDEANIGSKVILLTTEGQKEKIVKALGAGADDYVTKPFELDALLETIERVMSSEGIL